MGKGHRERLRHRFFAGPHSLPEEELLELLLSYAIPRLDVRPLALALIEKYGSLADVLKQPTDNLASFSGLGESSVCLLQVVAASHHRLLSKSALDKPKPCQASLPGLPIEEKRSAKSTRRNRPSKPAQRSTATPELRSYTNDLAKFAVDFLPEAARFSATMSYRDFLYERLPVNAQSTRERYSQYLIKRFFPGEDYPLDLVAFSAATRGSTALLDAVFYLTAIAEPILAMVAVEVVLPALPRGDLSRVQLLNGVEARLQVAPSAIRDTSQAIVRTYARLGVAEATAKELHLRLREGNLDALVFVLHREFPEPGMYDLRRVLEGPAHQFLLWSQDWIRKGLYQLRELGMLAKISEIDTVKQFTTKYTPYEAMSTWLKLREEGRT